VSTSSASTKPQSNKKYKLCYPLNWNKSILGKEKEASALEDRSRNMFQDKKAEEDQKERQCPLLRMPNSSIK
jgi:hypothetical protein